MPSQVFTFEKGIPGFEQIKIFTRTTDPESGLPFANLQAVEQSDIQFLLTNPFWFYPEYEFDLSDEAKQELGLGDGHHQEVSAWVVVTLRTPMEQSTINLCAPIVMNEQSGKAKQVILHDSSYNTRHPILAAYSENSAREEAL